MNRGADIYSKDIMGCTWTYDLNLAVNSIKAIVQVIVLIQ